MRIVRYQYVKRSLSYMLITESIVFTMEADTMSRYSYFRVGTSIAPTFYKTLWESMNNTKANKKRKSTKPNGDRLFLMLRLFI